MSLLDLITPHSEETVRVGLKGFMTGAGLKVTNWRVGDIVQQMFEASIGIVRAFQSIVFQGIRGTASLDLATDPGDVDPYDANNVNLEPAVGFLSTKGSGDYGVERGAATFATGRILFTNAGPTARTISPDGLTFTWTAGTPPAPAPTYKNSPDASVYTDAGDTVTVDVGASVYLPVTCDVLGVIGSCPSSSLSLTTTLVGCTATNPEPISGSDRQDAEQYRVLCRAAQSRLSFAGPEEAYLYFATRNYDGTPLLNGTGGEVGITRVWLSPGSTTGIVTVYYATDAGAPVSGDVTAANANIELNSLMIGGCITFVGAGATESVVAVTGTASIKARSGLNLLTVREAIVTALAEAWPDFPIGGFDNDGSNGVIYESDVEAIAKGAYAGLYDVHCVLTGSTIPTGTVPTLVSAEYNWAVTVVS